MWGLSMSIWVAVLVSVATLFTGIALMARRLRRARAVQTLWCPVHQTTFRAKTLRIVGSSGEAGQPVDVIACQPFGKEKVSCGKDCLNGATIFQVRQRHAGAASTRRA